MCYTSNVTENNNKSMKKVIVYSTPTCHYCHLAKDFFNEKGVEFSDVDVSVDQEALKMMVEKTGQMGVPVIAVGEGEDEQVVVGFDQGKLAEMLGLNEAA